MLELIRVVRIMPAHGRCQMQWVVLMWCQNRSWWSFVPQITSKLNQSALILLLSVLWVFAWGKMNWNELGSRRLSLLQLPHGQSQPKSGCPAKPVSVPNHVFCLGSCSLVTSFRVTCVWRIVRPILYTEFPSDVIDICACLFFVEVLLRVTESTCAWVPFANFRRRLGKKKKRVMSSFHDGIFIEFF